MKMNLSERISLDRLNAYIPHTMLETMGVRFTEIGDLFLRATMPVEDRTRQPAGLLHGGAVAALAESMGSIGTAMLTDLENYNVLGIEINANHLRSKRDGIVTGTASLVHAGRTSYVWSIQVTDENGKLLSICRHTVLVLPKSRKE